MIRNPNIGSIRPNAFRTVTDNDRWTHNLPSGGGTEQLISPPGLHDALFLNCLGGSTYVVPQNSDGTAGTPVAVADLSSEGSFGLAGFCNGTLWETGLGASVYSVTPIPSDLCVPQGVTAAASGTTATVSWTPIPYGVTSYTATASTGQTCTATAPATSCTVTGLAPGTAVTFTVTATYPAGTSAPSDPSSPVTPTASDSGGSSTPAKLASTGLDGGQLVLIGLLLSRRWSRWHVGPTSASSISLDQEACASGPSPDARTGSATST